jgi:hypothetical protein
MVEFGEAFGEVGEEFGGEFAFVTARTEQMRDGEEAGILRHG